MPNPVPYILATAGHVDHGKSSLVRALTGMDPDRLPEEKRRGITIDLGFAELQLPSPRGFEPAVTYQVGIVDVPGHEDFVRNMVAGVGSIDAALLLVAADDGWMPQTEEHLHILSYLGVSHGVVALSKADLAADVPAAIDAVRERLAGTPFAGAPIIPTSVADGRGITELKEALAAVLSKTPRPADIGKPRLPVDRVFSLRGIGTVVTGTLTGGMLRRGQPVLVQPGGISTRIRTIQIHNRDTDAGPPGARVALNLPDVESAAAGPAARGGGISRGDVVTLADLGRPASAIDVRLERTGRTFAAGARGDSIRQVKTGARVFLHHGSAALLATIRFYGPDGLLPGTHAFARLVLQKPLLALAGDRFVLRDSAQRQTLAGGVVLDASPLDIGRRGSAQRAARLHQLQQRSAAPDDPAVFALTELAMRKAVDAGGFLVHTRFSARQIASTSEHLAKSGSLIARDGLLLDGEFWRELLDRGAEAIDKHHRAHPEQSGLPLTDLRKALSAVAPLPEAMRQRAADAASAGLAGAGFVHSASTIRRVAHRPTLPPRLAAAGDRLRRKLAAGALEPPSRKELAPDDLSYQALKFLCASGEAVEINGEVVVAAEAYAAGIERLRGYLATHGAATVSELKTLLSSSRRVMVPLLEKLDREGITRREGDRRTLRV